MPPSQGQLEEEKEPHFIEGKRALTTMDYKGAIDEFEKAVEANPRNASAQLELSLLYERQDLELRARARAMSFDRVRVFDSLFPDMVPAAGAR